MQLAKARGNLLRLLDPADERTSTTQARLDAPAVAQINASQIMMGARHLPVAHYHDYSLEFN